MGFMHSNGKGVAGNYPEAIRWYRMAAEQGNASALSNLGFMFDHGQGVEQDDARALMYYNKAAKRGDVYANKNRDIIEARIAAHAARKVPG
jgi:TPR repeat protein